MAHRGFDEQMEALQTVRDGALDADAITLLRKSLAARNNFLVAKAAQIAEEKNQVDLLPDLLAAFDRFFQNPEKTDPQCWAKNALSRALSKLGCRDKEIFLRGLHHHQMEPVWGGRSDSAGTVRANCAHALIGCEGLFDLDLLILLVDLLADPDKNVRLEVVRAISQIGEPALPVLRLRALLPGEDAEVLAACFQALLSIDRDASIPFIARFLEAGDDTAGEAAFALAETRTPEALHQLLRCHRNPSRSADPWFADVLLSAIAITRLPEAIDYLISLIEREDREAPVVIQAIAKQSPGPDLRARLKQAVDEIGSPRLNRVLHEELPSSEA